jgi:hypothetical protein
LNKFAVRCPRFNIEFLFEVSNFIRLDVNDTVVESIPQ